MFGYKFMIRALIVGIPVALCAALLGVSLVLKRYSMIGDGLSHVGFGALAAASAFNWAPLPVAIPIVVLSAFLLLRLSENSKIKGDSAIALISSSALAIGVTIATLKNGMNTDISNYLFGSIVAASDFDAVLSLCLSAVVIVLYILFYNRIFAVTFDENFARATGMGADRCNLLIAVMIAVIIVLAMNLVGSLLVSALVIFPALSAMRIFKSFKSVTIFSAILSVICALTGIIISIPFDTPVGSTIVITDIVAFAICWVIGAVRK